MLFDQNFRFTHTIPQSIILVKSTMGQRTKANIIGQTNTQIPSILNNW